MPNYRDEAVILRTQRLGEADRIVTMLGKERGKIRAVAKGVRRTSSKFGARLEPFMVVQLQCWEGRTLDTVTQAVSLAQYGADIATDFEAYSMASAMVETADRLTEADPSPAQYVLLSGGLRALARRERAPRVILDSYLIRALSIAGWEPALAACAVCGARGPHERFVIPQGGSVCDGCARGGALRVDAATLWYLRALLAGEWDIVERAPAPAVERGSSIVAAMTQFHLERGLRSLDVAERDRYAPIERSGATPSDATSTLAPAVHVPIPRKPSP